MRSFVGLTGDSPCRHTSGLVASSTSQDPWGIAVKQVLVRAAAIGACSTLALAAAQWRLLLGDGGDDRSTDLGTVSTGPP